MPHLPPQYLCGVALFNAGHFFECHEVLEEIWLPARGAEREFLHALIQAAAALHHHQRGNRKGAAGVYGRARGKLAKSPGRIMGVDTRAFARELEEFFAAASEGRGPAPTPRIRLASGD